MAEDIVEWLRKDAQFADLSRAEKLMEAAQTIERLKKALKRAKTERTNAKRRAA